MASTTEFEFNPDVDPRNASFGGMIALEAGNQGLGKHLIKCKEEFVKNRAMACAMGHKAYITAPRGLDCTQSLRYKIHSACNHGVLVYIMASGWHDQHRAQVALATEFHKANPTLLLENRFPFLECQLPEKGALKDVLEDTEELIRRHLTLCNWVDTTTEALRSATPFEAALVGGPLTDQHVIIPTMRAVLVVFWPAPIDDADSPGHAAVVLTGDNSQMRSGPVALESLRSHQLPNFINTEIVAHVPLDKAALFLSELDKQECAANRDLQARNEYSASQIGGQLLEEARERLSLSYKGLQTAKAESFTRMEENATEKREYFKTIGYSDRQAALIARVTEF